MDYEGNYVNFGSKSTVSINSVSKSAFHPLTVIEKSLNQVDWSSGDAYSSELPPKKVLSKLSAMLIPVETLEALDKPEE